MARCPICKKQTQLKGDPYRPFCSERCKLLDLDNWLGERYRIPASSPETDRDQLDADDAETSQE
ncbi:MAG: DNA gyrase inhibitor YacG [Terriglobia bacterium]